jgi:transcriptional regulator with XRE-family HTH domain
MAQKDWGKRVGRLRDRLHLTQTELADLLGVHWTTVSRWERGVLLPRPSARRAIEEAEELALVRTFWHNKDRGMRAYGSTLRDINGGEMKVYDSSLTTDRACWVNVSARWNKNAPAACMLLNERQALELMRRLATWLHAQEYKP